MKTCKRHLGDSGANQRTEHVALCIPWIALGSQKRIRAASFNQRNSPLQKLVAGTDRDADTHHHKHTPPWPGDDPFTNQYFSRDDRGDEALGKMSELVIIVPRQVKMVAHPIEEGHLSIGIVASHQQNAGVKSNQQISQIGESEMFVGPRELSRSPSGPETTPATM